MLSPRVSVDPAGACASLAAEEQPGPTVHMSLTPVAVMVVAAMVTNAPPPVDPGTTDWSLATTFPEPGKGGLTLIHSCPLANSSLTYVSLVLFPVLRPEATRVISALSRAMRFSYPASEVPVDIETRPKRVLSRLTSMAVRRCVLLDENTMVRNVDPAALPPAPTRKPAVVAPATVTETLSTPVALHTMFFWM